MNQNTQFQSLTDRVIREDECRKLTGVSRTTRYELEKKGGFPSRRNLGAFCRLVAFRSYGLGAKP